MSEIITDQLTVEGIEFIQDLSNWFEIIGNVCQICEIGFGIENPFILVKEEEEEEELFIIVHYDCILKAEFVLESKEQELIGEVY